MFVIRVSPKQAVGSGLQLQCYDRARAAVMVCLILLERPSLFPCAIGTSIPLTNRPFLVATAPGYIHSTCRYLPFILWPAIPVHCTPYRMASPSAPAFSSVLPLAPAFSSCQLQPASSRTSPENKRLPRWLMLYCVASDKDWSFLFANVAIANRRPALERG